MAGSGPVFPSSFFSAVMCGARVLFSDSGTSTAQGALFTLLIPWPQVRSPHPPAYLLADPCRRKAPCFKAYYLLSSPKSQDASAGVALWLPVSKPSFSWRLTTSLVAALEGVFCPLGYRGRHILTNSSAFVFYNTFPLPSQSSLAFVSAACPSGR